MSNPFEVPSSDGRGGRSKSHPGDFAMLRSFEDGVGAMSRNVLPWFMVLVAVGVASVLSVLMCLLPALVVVPALQWGSTRFTLECLDGNGNFATAFSGFDRIGDTVPNTLVLILLLGLINLPGLIAGQVLSLVSLFTDDVVVGWIAYGVGTLIQLTWSVVVGSRFVPAMFMLVEGQQSPIECVTESWNLTANAWGKLMLFYVASNALMFAGLLFCVVGVIPAAMVATAAHASVYRQLVGARAS